MPTLPRGLSATDFSAALDKFAAALGADQVVTADEDVALYRDAYSPLWSEPDENVASAAVAPTTVEQVQADRPDRERVPHSAVPDLDGQELGLRRLGAELVAAASCVDLKRMNRILEVDERKLRARRARRLVLRSLSPHPGARAQGLDRQSGSRLGQPRSATRSITASATRWRHYRDHFGAHCGMEVVLPNGEVLRTGMGALPGAQSWQEYQLRLRARTSTVCSAKATSASSRRWAFG